MLMLGRRARVQGGFGSRQVASEPEQHDRGGQCTPDNAGNDCVAHQAEAAAGVVRCAWVEPEQAAAQPPNPAWSAARDARRDGDPGAMRGARGMGRR